MDMVTVPKRVVDLLTQIQKDGIIQRASELQEVYRLIAAHSAGAQAEPLRSAVKAVVAMLKEGEYAEHWASVNAPGDADAGALEEAITGLINETHAAQPMTQTDAARDQLRHFANAERFNRAVFEDDSAFADWVISRSRRVLAEIERLDSSKGE